jgi:hypothetical protein
MANKFLPPTTFEPQTATVANEFCVLCDVEPVKKPGDVCVECDDSVEEQFLLLEWD